MSESFATLLRAFRDERSLTQEELADRAGITVARSLVGNYITSLEMAGCSVTLLKVDDELVRLWDAPVNTPGLRWGASAWEWILSSAGCGTWPGCCTRMRRT